MPFQGSYEAFLPVFRGFPPLKPFRARRIGLARNLEPSCCKGPKPIEPRYETHTALKAVVRSTHSVVVL